MATKFTASEIEAALGEIPAWTADGDALVRSLSFADHITAFGFVTRVAMAAEAMDHHPDLRIVYNRVELRLSSHDAGGVTARDVRLARRINELA
ncbi:MAG: 4a-hydroxytetrahydrobiopterin dehydratase [Dehalococcoidia bacterium]|nr:4a-hydroxytetrahydrobiopterin dehydratase [Dehalococcoidia bacterium]